MSQFSDYLQSLFQQTGFSVYALSKASGVERTFLHKILGGSRIPTNESIVERLADAMRLSGEQSKTLYRLYQISRDGEDAYERQRAVGRLLTSLRPPMGGSRFTVQRSIDVQALPHAAHNRVTVLRLIKLLFDLESAEPHGNVRLLCGTEDEFLWHMLSMFLDNSPDMSVSQVLCFQQGGTQRALLHNLETLRRTLPLVITGRRYQPYVCYGGGGYTPLLPNLLLTSRYALQFADDFSFALLSDGPEQLQMFDALMCKEQRGCRPLLHRLRKPQELLEHYSAVGDLLEAGGREPQKLFALAPEPCVTPFLSAALLEKNLVETLSGQTGLLRDIQTYIAHIRALMGRCSVTHYFTASGARRFVETGRLTELPTPYYHPFSPEDCRALLCAQVRHAEQYAAYTPLLYDPEKFTVSENLMLETTAGGSVSLVYSHPDAEFLSFVLEEPLLCNALHGFMDSLRQSRCVSSREESLALLRQTAGMPAAGK